MTNILPPFPTFSVHEDNNSVGPRWKKWLRRFQMYLTAHDVTDDTRKRALLLYSAGEEVNDIFETLPNRGEDKDYKKAVDALNAYFQPLVNKTYEIFKFRSATQNPDESLDSYHVRLRRLAQTCEFTNEEEEIKAHIVLSCSSTRVRRKALRENMNLKAILDHGRSLEMSEQQAKGIEEHEKVEKVSEVKMMKTSGARPKQRQEQSRDKTRPKEYQERRENKKCYRCGGEFPHTGPCPALNKTCSNCEKQGHFAKVCMGRKRTMRVNVAEERGNDESESESTDEEYTYGIALHSVSAKARPMTEVTIEGENVKCLIDSGAGVNVIDSYTYKRLKNIQISPTSKKIFAYQSAKPLPVIGEFKANIKSAATSR